MDLAKLLSSLVTEVKKLDKSAYLFSVDKTAGKVAHVNCLHSSLASKDFDAKAWANSVIPIIGGKVCAENVFHI